MPRFNLYILVLFLSFSSLLNAQNSNNEDVDILEMRVQNMITQADFESQRGEYYKAKGNLDKALEIAIQIDDKKQQGVIHTEIAKFRYAIKEPEKALVSLTKAAEIQREINDEANLAYTYNIRGMLHAYNGEYRDALDYYNSSKNKLEEQGLEDRIAEVSLNEARVYITLEQYNDAKALLDQSIILSKKYNQQEILSRSLTLSGLVQSKLGNLEHGLDQSLNGLDIAKTQKNPSLLNESYLTLSDIYEETENYELSNKYLKLHVRLSDSILDIRRENLAQEKNVQYIQNYQEAKNEELKATIDEKEADSNLTRITTILSIALITILSLLTLSLYKNNNIRLKTNTMLHKKNDELVVAKEKAELASQTKANFLSTVTHELRTPLYAVTGLTNMLLDESPKPDQIKHLKSLKFSGDYLLTFINDILQVNKIEANKVEVDPELFSLHKKVENVIAALNNSALDNNIIMHFEYDANLPENFVADQLKISQILINLIGNAIKFTKDGDIWVRVYKVSEENGIYNVRFEIEDNGIGISKEKQESMFESFNQGSIQINRKYGGTGLGLSIVKGLIKILKGKIYLKSELGKGSTFFFEVPLEYSDKKIIKVVPKINPAVAALDTDNIRILVVEDNKINQMITKKILNKMKLQCDVVDNGEDAVENVKNNVYNVVLMDIHMPGISGLEATKRIRVFNKELTIFALTAVTLDDKMHEFDEAGFNDIISKPFKQADFEKKLYEALLSNKEKASKMA